jgi:hypothetical protein
MFGVSEGMEPLDDNNPANPRRPSGGTSLLMLLLLAFVVAGLLIWAYARSDPGQPNPSGTANPKVLPASGQGGPSSAH